MVGQELGGGVVKPERVRDSQDDTVEFFLKNQLTALIDKLRKKFFP